MQKIGNQIQFSKSKDDIEVEIFPAPKSKDKLTLIIWIIGWTLCGAAVVVQLLLYGEEFTREQTTYLLIYLSLWTFFEFKVLNAFRWVKTGKELIEIKDGTFTYTKMFGKRGMPAVHDCSAVSKFEYQESTEAGILNDINRSIWIVGGEVIQYQTERKVRRLGMKLPKKDALKLEELLNKHLGKQQANQRRN